MEDSQYWDDQNPSHVRRQDFEEGPGIQATRGALGGSAASRDSRLLLYTTNMNV
jgi:hypothetical protein